MYMRVVYACMQTNKRTNEDTSVAHRILTRHAGFLHTAVRTIVVLSAFRAGVMVGIERAAGARFTFSKISILGGDEFLARGPLCD